MADRVLLGLIPSAESSYEAGCLALNATSGGCMHIHGSVSSKDTFKSDLSQNSNFNQLHISCNRRLKSEWVNWAIKTAENIKNLLNAVKSCTFDSDIDQTWSTSWKTDILHIERVKSYAPHIDHLVLDLKCTPH